jgi:hypothetical protein
MKKRKEGMDTRSTMMDMDEEYFAKIAILKAI